LRVNILTLSSSETNLSAGSSTVPKTKFDYTIYKLNLLFKINLQQSIPKSSSISPSNVNWVAIGVIKSTERSIKIRWSIVL